MPKNNEFVNEVKKSTLVNTETHDTGKESIFLSDHAISKIKDIRDYNNGGLYLYQSYICGAMSDLSGFVDEVSSEPDKKAFINIMSVLRMYNELITDLAQEI